MAKFKVGDWVEVICPPTTQEKEHKPIAHIIEIYQQTCEAEIKQTLYAVRLWEERLGGGILLAKIQQ